jgi:Flp pilus assembly protein TadD
MSSLAPILNCDMFLRTDLLSDLADRLRSAKLDEASLFTLFATLAKEAGREDLQAEFTRRAQADSTALPATARQPLPDAERQQQTGCRLIREGKHADAEAAFREAIRLDPKHADAHGNLGVAFAHQRRLPEAEAAFRLAIRLACGQFVAHTLYRRSERSQDLAHPLDLHLDRWHPDT